MTLPLDSILGSGGTLFGMAKKITIEQLAEMTQNEFSAVRREMDGGFREMREMVGSVLKIAENIEGRIGEVRTLRSVDIPEIRVRLDTLENDMRKVKVKVHIR